MIRLFTYFLVIILFYSCSSIQENKISLIDKLRYSTSPTINVIDSNTKNSIVKEIFINAKTLQQQGKYAEAIIELNSALEYDSSFVILNSIAESYMMIYKFRDAEKILLNILSKDENYILSLELLAKVYFQLFDSKKSTILYEKLLNIDINNDNYRFILATLKENFDVDYAINLYLEIKDKNFRAKALSRLKFLLFNLKDKRLFKIYNEILENEPNSENFFYYFNYLNNNKDFLNSSELLLKYENILSKNEFLNAYYNFGLALLNSSIPQINEYLPFFKLVADSPIYNYWYIDMIAFYLYDKLGDSIKTNNYIDKFLTHKDSIPEVGLELAYYYRQKNNLNEAEKILKINQQNFKKDLRYYSALSSIYFFRKDFKKIAETYNEALLYDSNNIEIYIELGLAYNRLKDYQNSDSAYEKALNIDPNNALANNNYAFSLSERNLKIEKAGLMINIALSKEPNNASYLDTYAWILYKQEKYEEALIYINKSISNGDLTSEVFEHLGDIYLKMNNKIEALNAYEKGLKINPSDDALIKKVKEFK